ncbi:hypothetical protein R6242_15090 [Iodobacter sp. CM08]|uniref:hypothetical protein n=1 Tax=Iodobacter sp. CM08 TaxID=3085902 RepID=UPI00298170C8|nr:hypothetical protein [Iodobacter sp. CM08]MDW5417891.1 hypothetical protein [Iodobacter sp. CM08]
MKKRLDQDLEKFINKEKAHYPLTIWQQDTLEALLRGLFDPKVHSKDDEQKKIVRAARGYRLPEYFYLLLQEQIPALHSSQAYRIWLRRQWFETGELLKDLLNQDLLVAHPDVAEDWQDEQEFKLWDVLLTQFKQYTPEQQNELLTEYLQALPRFHAIETFTRGRVDMANLLGCVIANDHVQGQEILTKIWFDLPNAMLRDDRSTDVLIGYQDAMLVCFKISRQNTELASWAHEVLWGKFQKRYLDSSPTPRPLQNDLPTAMAATRLTEVTPINLRDFLLETWMRLRSLSTKQTDTTLSQKIEDWLFEVCWGEASPNHEQVEWWLDFLLFHWDHDRIRGGLSMGEDPTLRERMKKFSLKHKAEIEQKRQQQSGVNYRIAGVERSKAEVLHEVLTELHDGKN